MIHGKKIPRITLESLDLFTRPTYCLPTAYCPLHTLKVSCWCRTSLTELPQGPWLKPLQSSTRRCLFEPTHHTVTPDVSELLFHQCDTSASFHAPTGSVRRQTFIPPVHKAPLSPAAGKLPQNKKKRRSQSFQLLQSPWIQLICAARIPQRVLR
jgi:hypothetical protein